MAPGHNEAGLHRTTHHAGVDKGSLLCTRRIRQHSADGCAARGDTHPSARRRIVSRA